MNAMHVVMAGALAVASVMWCARAEPVREVFVRVECSNESLVSRSRSTNSTLFLASSADGWRADGLAEGGPAAGCGFGQEYQTHLFSLRSDVVLDPGFEFKVTRGSWETVEVDALGRDLQNRRLTNAQIAAIQNGEGLTIRVEGWADQRGTRWPAAANAPASTVTGTLEVHDFSCIALGNTRKVRVWLPPGYSDAANADQCYPVLYMHDGQNCFDAATSFAGEWGLDETATKLIEAGTIEPLIIVGIDNAGSARADEYSPMPLGSARPGMGGGQGDLYVQMLTEELMPWISERYRTKTGPENTALGGSSLGGVITLHTAMMKPGMFGAILVESPSLWVGDGQFKRNVIDHRQWPSRVYLGMGGAEYGKAEDDAALIAGVREVRDALASRGLGNDRLMLVVEDGAPHNEGAWARRLPGAMAFLFRRP